MEENIYYSCLFDIYGTLLTDKQQEYFRDYYFDNLLLDEISENRGISKNAVSKQIKNTKALLDYYEEKLGLYEHRCAINKEFETEPDILKRIEKYDIIK